MSGCPTDLELERFLGGTAGGAESAAVADHLGRCAACRTWVDDARLDESLLDDVRRVFSRLPPPEDRPRAADGVPGLARYRIVRKVGEGGMGIVYEAEQRGTRRRVALKVMRPGLCSERSLRRFEREVELLARLDHPGIARVFEADTFESGDGRRPFFAMELVDGRSPREHAEERGLGTRARLELFRRICDAVEHAHRAGVLHRDLKPANLLVDARGRPKVLDFGVACSLDPDARHATLEGEGAGFVGTLAFMSPEQLAGDPAEADVRSDVHALGVLLFQLLTGRLPHDVAGRPVADIVRAVAEDEPLRLGAVDPALRGELETICMKALARAPGERYASVADLAADVDRHLADLPIRARPPGPLVRAAKFTRRHRALVAAALLVFVALAGGLAASLVQAGRARRAEVAAAGEARVAQAVNDFLQEVLMQASPRQAPRAEPTIGEVLEEAAARIEEYTDVDPVVEAAIRHSLGRVLTDLGRYDEAARHLERALALRREHAGPRTEGVAGLLNALAAIAVHRRDLAEAERLAEEGLALRRALGVTNPKLLGSSLVNVGFVRLQRGRPAAAVPVLEEAVRVFSDSGPGRRADARTARQQLALALDRLGRSDEAEATLREVVEDVRDELGSDHPLLSSALVNLSYLLLRRADPAALDETARALEEAAAIRERRYGPDHPDAIPVTFLRGRLAAKRGDVGGAAAQFERAFELVERHLGEEVLPEHLREAARFLRAAGGTDVADEWVARAEGAGEGG